ncbi:MAG: hypothetical protein IT433_09555 [Phycisphaerales bacterium]|nr:hypothetical protein [Phycisphaerales bacterium]
MKSRWIGTRSGASALAFLLAAALPAGLNPLSPRPAHAQSSKSPDIKPLLTDALPSDAAEIADAMKSAKVGEVVALHGHVALAKDAISKDLASFTLVDETARQGPAPASDKLPDTESGVPASARAVVQVVDSAGQPLPGGLAGKHGLRPGAEVFVTGKVLAADGEKHLVVSIQSMHVPRSSIPPGFFLASAPAEARDISEARKAGGLKMGDQVVLMGRVGGSKTPFVAGRAIFTLMGRGLKACSDNPDDLCKQPWDYCCETRDDIIANSVTVQAVDAKGQVLRTEMKGRRGLRELSELIVVGKVTSTDGKSLVVTATGVHVVR